MTLPRHSARPKPTTGPWRGSHLPFGAKLHGRMHANCPLSGCENSSRKQLMEINHQATYKIANFTGIRWLISVNHHQY